MREFNGWDQSLAPYELELMGSSSSIIDILFTRLIARLLANKHEHDGFLTEKSKKPGEKTVVNYYILHSHREMINPIMDEEE